MNKIDEMIKEYCPNGVEFRNLKEICLSLKKQTLKQTNLVKDGLYPVINSGKDLYGFYTRYNNEGNAITIASRGEYAGFINYIKNNFWAGGLCYPYTTKDINKFSVEYIYYFLKSKEKIIMDTMVSRGSIPALNKVDIDNFPIPIPPLPIQQQIVNILDKFTELEAELEAELEVRKKQYEYYRDRLLEFEEGEEGVEWRELSEIMEIKNGYTPSKSNENYWNNGTIPWFRMEDIRAKGRILSDSIQYITKEAIKGNGLFPANSIIVATTATIGEHALITVDSLANQRFTFLTRKKDYYNKLNIKYFYYYMFIVDEWCKNNTNISGFASVDMNKFKKIKIPIPPLERQQQIVSILDKFDTIVNSITEGLPKEIELRKKQYEYYRDKLLTFKNINEEENE